MALTVAKATASITVTPYSVTYDAHSHTAGGTATGVGGVDDGPCCHWVVCVLLDEFHRRQHVVDPLTVEILKVAGLKERNNAFLDFFAE